MKPCINCREPTKKTLNDGRPCCKKCKGKHDPRSKTRLLVRYWNRRNKMESHKEA